MGRLLRPVLVVLCHGEQRAFNHADDLGSARNGESLPCHKPSACSTINPRIQNLTSWKPKKHKSQPQSVPKPKPEAPHTDPPSRVWVLPGLWGAGFGGL